MQRLLGTDYGAKISGNGKRKHQQQQQSDREAAEAKIFHEGGASVVYPSQQQQQYTARSSSPDILDDFNPIRRYLDEAKEQIDVIDFRRPR